MRISISHEVGGSLSHLLMPKYVFLEVFLVRRILLLYGCPLRKGKSIAIPDTGVPTDREGQQALTDMGNLLKHVST